MSTDLSLVYLHPYNTIRSERQRSPLTASTYYMAHLERFDWVVGGKAVEFAGYADRAKIYP